MAEFCRLLWRNMRIYWKTICLFVFPMILLPCFLIENKPKFRCMYVILLLALYWVFDILPLAITAIIPIVLFPVMGIMSSQQTALCYLKEVNMLFIGGLALAIFMEYVNLHIRIALNTINLIGCSPRKLLSGLMGVTMFISMWISNTAATSMMIPIVEAVLSQLEAEGFGAIYEKRTDQELTEDEDVKHPTRRASCYMISIAYSANIGGIGTLIGTGTNLASLGIIETSFPKTPGISFVNWMVLCIPIMLICGFITIVFMQVWYLGLLRPKSEDAKEIEEIKKGDAIAREVIRQKIKDLGPMRYNEIALIIIIILALLLWFFRKPEFIPGWAEQFTDLDVKDSSVAMFAFFLVCFILIRPKTQDPADSDPWRFTEKKLSWGAVLLLGCGFACAEATNLSGLSEFIADKLFALQNLPTIATMIIFSGLAGILTQFMANVAAVSIFLPILASLSQKQRVHPFYYMVPAAIAASWAFTLPVSTPPNAIALEAFNIPSFEMTKTGIFITIICLLVLWAIFPFLGGALFDMSGYPDWAEEMKRAVYNF